LDVRPNKVSPVRHMPVRLITFKDAFEPVEIREQNNTVEVVAENRDFTGSGNRLRKRGQLGHRKVLAKLLSKPLRWSHPRFRVAPFVYEIALKPFKSRIKLGGGNGKLVASNQFA